MAARFYEASLFIDAGGGAVAAAAAVERVKAAWAVGAATFQQVAGRDGCVDGRGVACAFVAAAAATSAADTPLPGSNAATGVHLGSDRLLGFLRSSSGACSEHQTTWSRMWFAVFFVGRVGTAAAARARDCCFFFF